MYCITLSSQSRKLMVTKAPPPPPGVKATVQPLSVSFTIPYNTYLENQPGFNLIQGNPAKSTVSYVLDVARIQGPNVGGINLLDFNAIVFRDPTTNISAPFAPTVRVKRGGTMTHIVSNNLITGVHNSPASNLSLFNTIASLTGGNGFHGHMGVNLHTHGLYGSPGVLAQPPPATPLGPSSYTGGDNIFLVIPPRPNTGTAAQSVTYTNPVPMEHMPGAGWSHAHVHGTTSASVATASGFWIVEDDPVFLPDSNGCGPLRNALAQVPERVIHMTTTNMQLPDAINTPDIQALTVQQQLDLAANNDTVLNAFLDAANLQFVEESSDQPMTTCCNATDPKFPFIVNTNQDVILINGGYMPRIKVPNNGWMRWRMLNVAIKPIMNLAILKSTVDSTVAPCQMQIIAKDGIYMMQIPRTVDTLYLGPGNRVEVLVKCSANVGDAFVLSSGVGPNPQGILPGCDALDPGCDFFHGYMATIEVGASDPNQANLTASITDEACTPLRSDYTADMRAVPAAQVVSQTLSMTDLTAFGCNMNNQWFQFPTNNPFTLQIGKVNEIMTQYGNHHSFHIHSQPFQLTVLDNITMLNPGNSFTNYFKEGDFHDTLYFPAFSDALVPLRLNPRFGGYGVAHCHILQHEDEGCMIVVKNACPSTLNSNAQASTCSGIVSPITGTYAPGGLTRSPPPPPPKGSSAVAPAPVTASAPSPASGVGVPAIAPGTAPAPATAPAPTPAPATGGANIRASPPPPAKRIGRRRVA